VCYLTLADDVRGSASGLDAELEKEVSRVAVLRSGGGEEAMFAGL
jgi:hypothetical protein